MCNPLKRRPRNDTKPTLRERAATLRATAARVIRRPLPAAGSEAAQAAYKAARIEDARRSAPILEAYPELRRGSAWWTTEDLSRAFEAGEIAPAEAARLYPLASERELRLRAIEHRLNLGALHFLAFAADAGPAGADDVDSRPDPVHAAIRSHRDAYAEWNRHAQVYNELAPSDPAFAPAYQAAKEPAQREAAAYEALLSTPATTVEGLRLLIDYLPTATRQASTDVADSDERRALDLIRASFMSLEDAQRLVSEPRSVVKLPPVADLLSEAVVREWVAFTSLCGADAPEDDASIERHSERRGELFKAIERLPATRKSLTAKALALALIGYVDLWVEGRPRQDYATDGRLALDIHAIVTGDAPSEELSDPDPALAAIAASRAAEAEMAAFQARAGRRRGGMTPALHEEEDRLCMLQGRTRDIALATVPTSRAGQLALVDYIRFTRDLHGVRAGDGPDVDDAHTWRDTHAALMRALVVPVSPAEFGAGLSDIPTSRLGNLYETITCLWLRASAEIEAPWCWGEDKNHNAAGKFLDAEAERQSLLLDAIVSEARRRVPTDDAERNDRLALFLRHELQCGEGIADRALLAEINAAWGA